MSAFKNINISPDRLRTLDPGDMLGKTLELPDQIERGIELGIEFADKHKLEPLSELDWFGLGGSAVAGDLLQGFGYEPPRLPCRINVQRFPRESSARRLVSSYSGNTVESLHAFKSVPASQIWMSMSAGGALQELAAKAAVPHLLLPGGYPPRAAVGFGLGAMLAVLHHVYKLGDPSAIHAACARLRTQAAQYRELNREGNPALALAVKLIDKTPVIYTLDGLLMPAVGLRLRAQFAENSKVWSHMAPLPEMAHNEVESFGHLGQLLPPPMVIFLGRWVCEGLFADPRPGLRSTLDDLSIEHMTVDPDSPDRLASGLDTLFLLDAATVYLALLKAVDPLEIPVITKLKNSLTRS